MTEWLSLRSCKYILFILRGNIGTWCILVSCCFGHKLLQISCISTILIYDIRGFPRSSVGKESQCRRPGFNSWVRKIPWRMNWQPTPVFLPGESPGQRRLVGNSPWGHKSWTWLSDYTTTINLWYYSSADHKFDRDIDGLKSTCWRGYICSGGCGEKSIFLPFPSSWGCLGHHLEAAWVSWLLAPFLPPSSELASSSLFFSHIFPASATLVTWPPLTFAPPS